MLIQCCSNNIVQALLIHQSLGVFIRKHFHSARRDLASFQWDLASFQWDLANQGSPFIHINAQKSLLGIALMARSGFHINRSLIKRWQFQLLR